MRVEAEAPQDPDKKGGAGHAIDVVVSKNRNHLSIVDRVTEALGRLPQVGDGEGVAKIGKSRIQEPFGRIGIRQIKMTDQLGQD